MSGGCPVAVRFCPFCRSGHSASSDGAKEPLLPYEQTQNCPEIIYNGTGIQVLIMVRFYDNVTYRVFFTSLPSTAALTHGLHLPAHPVKRAILGEAIKGTHSISFPPSHPQKIKLK